MLIGAFQTVIAEFFLQIVNQQAITYSKSVRVSKATGTNLHAT